MHKFVSKECLEGCSCYVFGTWPMEVDCIILYLFVEFCVSDFWNVHFGRDAWSQPGRRSDRGMVLQGMRLSVRPRSPHCGQIVLQAETVDEAVLSWGKVQLLGSESKLAFELSK